MARSMLEQSAVEIDKKVKSYLAFLENSLEAQDPEEDDEDDDDEDDDDEEEEEEEEDDIDPEEGMGGDVDDVSADETDPNADFQEPWVEL